MRIRAILKALYHGFAPYWFYEETRHYDCSYYQHLLINLKYAWRWMRGKEDESDIEFELKLNYKRMSEVEEFKRLFEEAENIAPRISSYQQKFFLSRESYKKLREIIKKNIEPKKIKNKL